MGYLSIAEFKLGSTRNLNKLWFSSLVPMLSVRSIFARHFLIRLHVTTRSKPISMHQPGLAEKNAPGPKELEKEPLVAKDAIPLSAKQQLLFDNVQTA